MKFGAVPVPDAVGATVVHTVQLGGLVLKKGETVTHAHAAMLAERGLREIVVARLEADDVGENEAAQSIATALAGREITVERAFTGRANLFARHNGILQVEAARVDDLNAVDESLTLATLPPYRAVTAGEMVATVKIIPFAVSRPILDQALALASRPVVQVHRFQPLRVGVLSTVLPGLKPAVVRKTVLHLAARLAPAAAPIVVDEALPHDAEALATRLAQVAGLCDIIVVFGASAITDRRDIIPMALLQAGGTIEQFGMPVDPGNLLLLGRLGGAAVIGAPGCARSPKENGFDWVLQRLLAGLEVTRADVRRLGVGGLLMEIVSRPQPRLDGGASAPPLAEPSAA
ncbi:molybdopterin-binding protein [Lichenihabitans sp. Uapishka_5]|uniref:molybdopterin-binding protein n=1 Tax=Lichenihabitans sp. Uapishka_5 TaxID=3037302 RepID=UPI0029E7DB1D|nr:molybdopterin-binding protein [Lichenihabitans sp. Uapishka_5]MDX7949602.1 molybdopterin-binding protein [Lichenihabitans sp. Uapishka_5]